jgi:hypothetical protein
MVIWSRPFKQRHAVRRRDQHSTKAKAGQTGLTAIAKQYRARGRSEAFALNIWARRRKMRREMALRTSSACHALDNSIDRRYERPLIEDA